MFISGEKSDDAFTDVVEVRVTHVYGSPEAFVGNETWRSLFVDDRVSGRVVALAIDEAYCIVKWCHAHYAHTIQGALAIFV